MTKKNESSSKAKKYSLILFIISIVFLLVAFTLPLTLKAKEVKILADKSLSVANSITPVLNNCYGKEIENIRNHPDINSSEFKKINNILIETSKNNNCSRIFAIYKGVGGKYYNMLESYYHTDNIGIPMNEKYYMNYKGIWDRIITEKIYSDYNTKLLESELGKSVIAWSALKNESGKTVAILGVQNSMTNMDFNNFSLKTVYLIQLIICICFILGVLNFYYAIKIFVSHIKTAKGIDKKQIKKENAVKEKTIAASVSEISEPAQEPETKNTETKETIDQPENNEENN